MNTCIYSLLLRELIKSSRLWFIDLVSSILAKNMNSRGLFHSPPSRTSKALERCCVEISRKSKCQNLQISTSLKVWGFRAPNAAAELCLETLLRGVKSLFYELLRTDAVRRGVSFPGHFRTHMWWDTIDKHIKHVGNLADVKWSHLVWASVEAERQFNISLENWGE